MYLFPNGLIHFIYIFVLYYTKTSIRGYYNSHCKLLTGQAVVDLIGNGSRAMLRFDCLAVFGRVSELRLITDIVDKKYLLDLLVLNARRVVNQNTDVTSLSNIRDDE